MRSIWQQSALPQFPALDGDIKTDVLIIGGGIAGILTAWFLQQNGVEYVLVEKDRICGKNTQNTTAKISVQHGLIYDKLIRSGGVETAQKYLQANQTAFDRYAELCSQIPCDYEIRDSYVYALNREKLEREMLALEKIGYAAQFRETLPLPIETAGAVKFPKQAQFDPLQFLGGISEGLRIYENTWVRAMIGTTAVTDNGRIHAEKVVCATHFPFINKHGLYFLKLYQHRSYVLALENSPIPDGMYVDEDLAGLSFRSCGDLLLLGGGGGRTGNGCGGWKELRRFAMEHYPDAKERCLWAAQDCMSLDGRPYIGRYGRRTPRLYVETGFNKWGMTGAMLSAMLITDRILGKRNPYADLFRPDRSILKPQLFVNGFEAFLNILTPSKKTCPHMFCALKWNEEEQNWQCPCHGSRFSADGTVLDNPSNADLH